MKHLGRQVSKIEHYLETLLNAVKAVLNDDSEDNWDWLKRVVKGIEEHEL